MRRWIILLVFLCLSAGAFALTNLLDFSGEGDTDLSTQSSDNSVQSPMAALDTSPSTTPADPSSEQTSPGQSESADQEQKSQRSGRDATTVTSDGVKLDLAQISTSGASSVFAGQAAPGASVTVFDNGAAVATTTANANGDWSLVTDHKFSGPEPNFRLRLGAFKPQVDDDNSDKAAPAPPAAAPVTVSKAAVSQPNSPSRALLKDFENKVAIAREEAEAKSPSPSTPAAEDTPIAAPPAAPTASATSVVSKPTTSADARPSAHAVEHEADQAQSASIPVPMTFVFDEATLTSDGEKTAQLLLEYLRLKKFTTVRLTGHADERGTAEYNMDLSRKRLDTVSAFLRSRGYQGKLDLVPKGASEPFTGVDRSKYSRDDLMQLDRRVELRNAS